VKDQTQANQIRHGNKNFLYKNNVVNELS